MNPFPFVVLVKQTGFSPLKIKIFILQEDMDHFGDVGSLDDNVESFLSPDDGDGRDLFGSLKRNPSEHAAETSKGIYPFVLVVLYI